MDALTLAAQLVAKWEGYREFPYPDPASPLAQATRRLSERWGREPARQIMAGLAPLVRTLDGKPWTVGFGQTGEHIGPDSESWSRAVAQANLEGELEHLWERMAPLIRSKLTPYQAAALLSFTYNEGLSRFKGSTLRRKLNLGDFDGAAAEFKNWTRAGNAHPLGPRRDDERVMFEGFHPLLKGKG